jgi:hypothetical protein
MRFTQQFELSVDARLVIVDKRSRGFRARFCVWGMGGLSALLLMGAWRAEARSLMLENR